MALPPSSPRLPSPPPPTEIQIGPQSPSLGGSMSEITIEQSVIDGNSKRRIHPGTKSADMAAGPPLIPLNELDSAFQLQEHLKALHYYYSKPPDSDDTIAITRETAILIATQPEGVDRALWLYELCRFLINKCNDLIVGFLFDDPPCSATTCPEMRASEWQFLCAVHESPKSCCAIDYCCHTLDWATNIVTSQKIFPSRLSLGAGDAVDERGAGVKHLTNIFRRLHRIFAHAWFQHRGVFWQVEGQTGLYVLFKTVCDTYDLLPAENYKLPPEAEGLEPVEELRAPVPSIMKAASTPSNISMSDDDSSRKNTRRHIRQSPSVGSAVTTVLESDEDEEVDVTHKLKDLQIAEEEEDEDEGATDIPVIVESFDEDEPRQTQETEAEHASLHEIEQTSEPSAVAAPPISILSNLSYEAEEKSEHRPQTAEKQEIQEDSHAEFPDEARGEALLSAVAEEADKPAVEKHTTEEIVEMKESKEDADEVIEKTAEIDEKEKKVEIGKDDLVEDAEKDNKEKEANES
ncbi:related to cell cycle regulation Mob3 [Rhynchosporium secalis]|uniref:Related to cell cycle regulation Mob3 n=1 Tax=Rhynchosporium secalis TaxID=38038 RepID=A0A1E1M426_RHYSE|nr:related to cell cycle regulation Mob3 [Rhynchosporium secalis]